MSPYPTRRAEFLNGVKATVPLVVGSFPFGIIFGALAVSSTGLTALDALGLSALVYAGSAQFIGIGLSAQGTSAAVIILTTFVINLRHALYSITLSPHMGHLPQRWLLPLAFWLTDETFVVVIQRYNQPDNAPYKHWFYLGSAVLMYTNWQLSTLVGIVAGAVIPDPLSWGLDFAMFVTFIGILVPMIRTKPVLLAVLAAGVTALLLNGLPNKLGLVSAAIIGVAVGMIAETFLNRAKESAAATQSLETQP